MVDYKIGWKERNAGCTAGGKGNLWMPRFMNAASLKVLWSRADLIANLSEAKQIHNKVGKGTDSYQKYRYSRICTEPLMITHWKNENLLLVKAECVTKWSHIQNFQQEKAVSNNCQCRTGAIVQHAGPHASQVMPRTKWSQAYCHEWPMSRAPEHDWVEIHLEITKQRFLIR